MNLHADSAGHLSLSAPPGQHLLVHALHPGSFHLPDREVFQDAIHASPEVGSKVPSFAFLIQHPVHGKVMFDLGLRQHGKGYPPALDENLQLFVVDCPRDVVALLGDGAVRPRDITTVIYSHLHFDHIGDLTPFAFAELFVGAAAEEFINDSYPSNPDGFFPELPPAQKVRYVHFDAAQPPARILAPLGSFARGLDLFGDGSLYLLDAPGHFPGHLAALVRVAPEQFVLLAADCCHNRLCYSPGERLISSENYLDIEVARETVQKLKQMDAADNVVVVLAHEKERLGEMPLFPIALNDWATEQAGQKNLGLYALTKK